MRNTLDHGSEVSRSVCLIHLITLEFNPELRAWHPLMRLLCIFSLIQLGEMSFKIVIDVFEFKFKNDRKRKDKYKQC